MSNESGAESLRHFAGEVVVSMFIFAIIAVGAYLLHLSAEYLKIGGMPEFFLTVFDTTEKVMIIIDSAFFIAFLGRNINKFGIENAHD